mmetsp:Transcript_39599/g.60579  ORF Transcript_39599/g.60579 Transcript_39599/m.60579 type:complete len:83 (+) Transcript_39599:34-282(+)
MKDQKGATNPTIQNQDNSILTTLVSTTDDNTGRFGRNELEPKSAEFRNTVSKALRKISDFDKSSADEEEMRDKIMELHDKTY